MLHFSCDRAEGYLKFLAKAIIFNMENKNANKFRNLAFSEKFQHYKIFKILFKYLRIRSGFQYIICYKPQESQATKFYCHQCL